MPSATERVALFLAAVATLLLTCWVYLPGQSGPALLDDVSSVMVIGDLGEHPEYAWDYIKGDTSGPLGRPVSIASFVLEKIYLDDNLVTSKRVNIGIHLVNGVLVIWLYLLLFKRIGTPGYRWLAILLGAGWLLSPLFVSTVLYAVQRMAMLSTLFMLAAGLFYVYWRRKLHAGIFSVSLLALAGGNILLALLAKENAVVVVPLLLLLEALWFQFEGRDGHTITWLKWTVLGLIFAGALAVSGFLVLEYDTLAGYFQHRYFTLEERLLTQGRILWDYVAQVYFPDVLRMGLYHDDVVVSTSLASPASTLHALLGWACVALVSCLLLLSKSGRYLVLGIAWFLVGHSVESTVLPLELYFEHRNYFPAIGLFLVLGVIFASLVKRWPEFRSPLLVYLGCYVLWLATLTGSQVQIWSSHPLLILNHLNGHPDSFRANSDMAVQMANLGQFAAAQKYSARAYAVSNGERSGDHDIRDLALACIANRAVAPEQIDRLGTENPERPFGSVVTLHTMVHLLQDGACPEFDRLRFADRMAGIYLAAESPATASANIYQGLALLENTLQRWDLAERYIDLYLDMSPDSTQGLLMKLHFVTALGKVGAARELRSRLLEMQGRGLLTVGEQQTLSLYPES